MSKNRKAMINIHIFIFYLFVFNGIISLQNGLGFFNYIDDVVVGIFFIMIFFRFLIRRKENILPIIIFYAISIITILLSIVYKAPIKNIILGYSYFFKPIIILLYFYQLNFNKVELEEFMKKMANVAIIILIGSVLEVIFYPRFTELINNTAKSDKTLFGIHPLQSFFTHPNIFSFFMGYWAIYYLIKANSSVNKRNNNFFLFVMFFLGTVFSLRRKGIFSIAFVIIFLLISKQSKIKVSAKNKFIIAIVLIVFTYINKDNLVLFAMEYFNGNKFYASGYNTRYLLIDVGYEIMKNNFPFGEGLGMFGGYASSIIYSNTYYKYNLSSLYGFSEGYAFYTGDNYFGHIMGEMGIIGVILFVCTFVYLFFKLRKTITYSYINMFIYLILITSIIELFGLCLYEISLPSYMIFSVIGMVLTSYKSEFALRVK